MFFVSVLFALSGVAEKDAEAVNVVTLEPGRGASRERLPAEPNFHFVFFALFAVSEKHLEALNVVTTEFGCGGKWMAVDAILCRLRFSRQNTPSWFEGRSEGRLEGRLNHEDTEVTESGHFNSFFPSLLPSVQCAALILQSVSRETLEPEHAHRFASSTRPRCFAQNVNLSKQTLFHAAKIIMQMSLISERNANSNRHNLLHTGTPQDQVQNTCVPTFQSLLGHLAVYRLSPSIPSARETAIATPKRMLRHNFVPGVS